MSAFQKVATFQVTDNGKQGGNVAAYFCTPTGEVLHAVAGPVSATTFLREARWANETYQMAQLEARTPAEAWDYFRTAHLGRLRYEHHALLPRTRLPNAGDATGQHLEQALDEYAHLRLNNQGKVHLLLAVQPMVPLNQVYQVVFEKVLKEKISTDPVRVATR